MSTSTVNVALANGSQGAKSNLTLVHTPTLRSILVLASNTSSKQFTGVRVGDELFINGDTAPVTVSGNVEDNINAGSVALVNAQGITVATATIPANGGTFSFTDAPSGIKLVFA